MTIKNYVTTPIFIQMESTECGAICLQIILAYYGSYYSASYLRQLCDISRDGTNLDNMILAAQLLGLESQGFNAELDEKESMEKNLAILQEIPFPYVIHWDLDHFVVLEGINKTRLCINDPALGRYQMDYNEFLNHFTGIVMSAKPDPHFKKNPRQITLFSMIKKRIQPYLKEISYLIILNLFLILPQFLIPGLSKVFIDSILIHHQHQWLTSFLWIFLLVSIMEVLMISLQLKCMLYLQTKISIEQTQGFFKKIIRLPSVFFLQRLPGDLSYRMESIDRVSLSLVHIVTTLFNLISIIFFLFIIFLFSPLLGYSTLILSSLFLCSLWIYSKKTTGESLLYQQQTGRLFGEASSALDIIDTIKTEGLENIFFNKITGLEQRILNTSQKFYSKIQWALTIPVWIIGANSVVIISLGVWLVMQNRLTVGALIAINMLMGNIYMPLKQLNDDLVELKQIEGDLVRQDDVLEYPKIKKEKTIDKKELMDQKPGSLSLEQVSFGYNHHKDPIINNINLTVKHGQHIVIMGETGSGKSTLLNLINGLHQPWSGIIRFGSYPLHSIPRTIRNRIIATISQSITLFEGTIRENLTLWESNIDDEELISACKTACIYTVVTKRGGLDAVVENDGTNFSGGERQRLEMARALAQKPDFLILDEATSAMDSITEQEVIKKIKQLSCGIISVSHRLGIQKNADHIIILDHGRIVEEGSHEELLIKNGMYAQFARDTL